jgi:selenocysteine lyase/cysteine desulfurase
VRALAAWLRDALRAVPGVTVQDRGETLCGIVTFTVAGRDPEDLKASLRRRADRPDGTTDARPINVTTSTTASSLFDFATRDVTSWVRASVHYYNTEDELAEFVEAVGELSVVS